MEGWTDLVMSREQLLKVREINGYNLRKEGRVAPDRKDVETVEEFLQRGGGIEMVSSPSVICFDMGVGVSVDAGLRPCGMWEW